jgi:hypothetical protein
MQEAIITTLDSTLGLKLVSLVWYGSRRCVGRRGVLGPEDEVGGAVLRVSALAN